MRFDWSGSRNAAGLVWYKNWAWFELEAVRLVWCGGRNEAGLVLWQKCDWIGLV